MNSKDDRRGAGIVCHFCGVTDAAEKFAPRPLGAVYAPLACVDRAACEARVGAACVVARFAREWGPSNPPGVLLVAVLLVADRPVPCDLTRDVVRRLRAGVVDHDREYASDLAHALRTSLITQDCARITYAPGPRFEAIAKVTRTSPEHLHVARSALVCAGFLPGRDP